jgi:hypothetical protein
MVPRHAAPRRATPRHAGLQCPGQGVETGTVVVAAGVCGSVQE